MAIWVPLACLALGMTVPLEGTVVSADGQPVAGASVWLGDTFAIRKGPEVLAAATTDDRGRFRLERDEELTGRGGMWSPTLWAYKPGSRVAFLEFKRGLPRADEPTRLVLGPPASAALRVVQPDGKPAREARVRLAQVNLKAPRPPDGLLDRLATTTDAQGRAAIDGFAPADIHWLDVTVKDQLVQCLPIEPDTGTVTLRALGRLKVRITADDPKALKGWRITARSRPTEPGYTGPYTTHWSREFTDDKGVVDFPALAEGQVVWTIEAPEGSDYLVAAEPRATIRAGAIEDVTIAVRRAVRVEGVVREEPGGAPIPGVKLDLNPLRVGSRVVKWLVTDAQGRFSGLVLPGTIRFNYSLNDMPKDYFLPPRTQHWLDFEVKAGETRHEFTAPPLRKGALVRGTVLDETGKPAAGVNVVGSWTSAEFGANPNSIHALTNAQGAFVLGNLPPKAEVRVSASTGSVVVSDAVTVPKAGEGEPIALALRKKPALALSGRVLDREGRPLAGVVVHVLSRPPAQRPNSGANVFFDGSAEVGVGPDGRFKTPAQLPLDHEFRVQAEAPGHEPSWSPWISAPRTDVPEIRLRPVVGTREVAGTVVDSSGKPVAGAEVFQSGDGPRRIAVTTGEDGRFRVRQVPKAPAFLFVSKPGHHFVGRRVNPADPSVDFTIRRFDEPTAPLRAVAAPVSRDEERALARALIAEALKAPIDSNSQPVRPLIAEVRALIDPDAVIEQIENQVIPGDAKLLAAIAVSRYEGDPSKALEVLDAVDQPETASAAALDVFDRLRSAAPTTFRRALLERAEQQARRIEVPGQAASELARVADRQLDLGDAEHGAKLVREAQALAVKPSQSVFLNSHDEMPLALARVDLPAALKLMEGGPMAGQPTLKEWIGLGIAKRIAPTNPAEARRILATIQKPNQPWPRCLVGLRMATKDLASAEELIARMDAPFVKALLPASAAKGRAESDPEAARALLRESVERLMKLRDFPIGPRAPSVALARLLPLAIRLDPDRAPDYLWMAVSLRPPLSPLPERMPVLPEVRQHYLALAELALIVARYDRDAAEVVFAPVAARLVGFDDEMWGLGNEGPAIFKAAGAFDARVAKALLDALPEDPAPEARPPGQGFNFRHHSKAQARIALAKTLALPPALRFRETSEPLNNDLFEDIDE